MISVATRPPRPRFPGIAITKFEGMATNRRKRGEAVGHVALFTRVDPVVKAKVERVAEALAISQAAAAEMMLASVEVDANGRPSFYTGDLPTDAQKELPLTG